MVGLQRQKRKKLGKPLPAFKALKKAQRHVDKHISASFKLKPLAKRTKRKDIAPRNIGFKFRTSKTNPLFLVERVKHRIDSPFEKFALIQSRKRKSRKKKVIKRKVKRMVKRRKKK